MGTEQSMFKGVQPLLNKDMFIGRYINRYQKINRDEIIKTMNETAEWLKTKIIMMDKLNTKRKDNYELELELVKKLKYFEHVGSHGDEEEFDYLIYDFCQLYGIKLDRYT